MIYMNDRDLLRRISDKASYISAVSDELYTNMEIGADEQQWLSDVYLDLQDIAEQLDAYRKFEQDRRNIMEKKRKIVKANGEKVLMTYDEVCHILGFVASAGFVEITTRGTISYSCGKPDEIRHLYGAVIENGFVPSKTLKRTFEIL